MQNDPNQPMQPDQPFPPNQYGQPGQYGQPNQPGQYGQPGQPNQPGQYGQPGQPNQPGQYGQPGQPFPPTQYGQPAQPGQFNQQYPYNQQPPYAPGMQPPYGQPMMPPKKKSKVGLIIGIIVAALVVCGVIGALAMRMIPSSTTTTSTNNTSNANQSSGQGNHKVGDTVTVNDKWTAQLMDVKTTPGNDIIKPKAGDIFVVVHVNVKNTSSETLPISSLLYFKLQDNTGKSYNETIDPDAGTTPDGKVAANASLTGSIVYEVPSSQHNFTLKFTPDLTSTDQAAWDLSVQ